MEEKYYENKNKNNFYREKSWCSIENIRLDKEAFYSCGDYGFLNYNQDLIDEVWVLFEQQALHNEETWISTLNGVAVEMCSLIAHKYLQTKLSEKLKNHFKIIYINCSEYSYNRSLNYKYDEEELKKYMYYVDILFDYESCFNINEEETIEINKYIHDFRNILLSKRIPKKQEMQIIEIKNTGELNNKASERLHYYTERDKYTKLMYEQYKQSETQFVFEGVIVSVYDLFKV